MMLYIYLYMVIYLCDIYVICTIWAKVDHTKPEWWRPRCSDRVFQGLGGRSPAGWLRLGLPLLWTIKSLTRQCWACTFGAETGEFHWCCILHQAQGEAVGGRGWMQEMEGRWGGYKGQGGSRILALSYLSFKRSNSWFCGTFSMIDAHRVDPQGSAGAQACCAQGPGGDGAPGP